MQNKTNEQQNR